MNKNMGKVDRSLRFTIGVLGLALYYKNSLEGFLVISLLIGTGLFFVTSLIGKCPLYTIFELTTKTKDFES